MDFSHTADQLAFAEALGKCLDRSIPGWPDRAWKDPHGLTARLMPDLGSLGIFGSLVPEARGGSGLKIVDIVPAIIEAGRRTAPVPLIESILAATILAEAVPSWAASVLSGKEIASIAWSGELALSNDSQPRLSGELPDVAFGGMSRWVVATVSTAADRRGLVVLDMTASGIRTQVKAGFDLSYPLCDIAVHDLPLSRGLPVWDGVAAFRAAGAVLCAAELLGLASDCLERAMRHLGDRKQFGKPLAGNQALRHMAADDLVALESSRLAVDYAAWALGADLIGASRAVSVAKSYASRAATRIAENAIQFHGGIGFTWEHGLHVILRRILRCAFTLGTAAEHQEQLAADFLAENVHTRAI